MDIEFQDSELEDMAFNVRYAGRWAQVVVRAYRKVMTLILNAKDRRDLYGLGKSLSLEKLKGKRKHQHSMRLNDQYRLIVEFKSKKNKEIVAIVNIEDYH